MHFKKMPPCRNIFRFPQDLLSFQKHRDRIGDLAERRLIERIDERLRAPFAHDKPAFAKHRQMMRDRGPGEFKLIGDLPGGMRPVPELSLIHI